MSILKDNLDTAIKGQNSLIYLYSLEEDRVVKAIEEYAAAGKLAVNKWSCITGLSGAGDDSRDPVVAIQSIISSREKGFFLFKDLSAFLDQAEVTRIVKEFSITEGSGTDRFLLMIDSELKFPERLQKEIHLILVPPPAEDEIEEEFNRIRKLHPDSKIPKDFFKEIILALKGLTLTEITSILHRVFKSGKTDKEKLLDEIFTEKQMIVRKTGYLEFTPPKEKIAGMGGLGFLKEWLTKREKVFSKEALAAGVPIPKGLLVMGVSGCGKSLAIKTIPALWNVPLYRLDMNLVFSGLYGSPEAAFHNALKILEAVAPAVLWIDEIENALGIEEDGLTISSHIFSSFLTWMQEKPPLIFIAATANNIHALPAEIIRKGRFDQVFFVDLPNEEERREIFTIYLTKNGADPAKFDLKMLSILTKEWNGAEIEQVVASARTDAFYENREFNENDITFNINKTVALSKTMEAQIKGIRSWALSRATPASKHGRIHRY